MKGIEKTTDEQLEQALIYIDSLHEMIENTQAEANAGHDKARNQAIQDCIDEIERLNDDGVLYEHTARKVLESLKTKP